MAKVPAGHASHSLPADPSVGVKRGGGEGREGMERRVIRQRMGEQEENIYFSKLLRLR